MHFNVYNVRYSQCSHQHVPVALTATFRMSSNQYTTPSTHYLHAGLKLTNHFYYLTNAFNCIKLRD